MKTQWFKVSFAVGSILMSSLSYGQKMNETDAAVAYKNQFQPAFMEGDMEGAKKALLKAKEKIDLAAENAETKENQKTLYYKGAIYSGFFMVGMQSMDTNFLKLIGEDGLDKAAEALKSGYSKTGKMKSDIEDCAKQNQGLLMNFAGIMYTANQFKEAAEVYALEAKFADAINLYDTNAVFNAAISYEKVNDYPNAIKNYLSLTKAGYKGAYSYALASSAMRKNKQYEDAKILIAEARKKYPLDKDLILESVNTFIDLKDQAGAEASLNEAITKDPNNKQLHYTIGTIYIDLKENEKAEQALNKSLEIDPEYTDALYQLGAHLVTWAGDTKTAANQLKFGDPNYNKMLQQADDTYKRALVPLEKYTSIRPEDCDVLNILFQINRNIGNTEKALEYKKKVDNPVEPTAPYGKPDDTSKLTQGEYTLISYTYNCYAGAFRKITYTKGKTGCWTREDYQSSPCK